MVRVHIFADESGNFDFSLKSGATRYFVLTTVSFFDDMSSCRELQQLRYSLAWEGIRHPGVFHAQDDRQALRDRVFGHLQPHRFRIDATVLEKRKAMPHLRQSEERLYKYAWYYHLKHVAPQVSKAGDEVLVIAASIGNRRRGDAFHSAVADVVSQTMASSTARTASWRAETDTGLQIADYCGWAIQRNWESKDDRSYVLIRDKIKSEYDLFSSGTTFYY